MGWLNSCGRRVSESETWGAEDVVDSPIGCEFVGAVLDGAMDTPANRTDA